jgi:hypothetical protein
MYSKTRNTLTALTAASLFAAAGWLFGHPVSAAMPLQPSVDLNVSIADNGTRNDQGLTVLHIRHANRMNLAMPYYSFALLTSPHRAD